MTDYSGYKIHQLKQELRQRGAILRGNKAELIERLRAYDTNDFFSAEPEQQLKPTIPTPPYSTYKDINADTPRASLTQQHVDLYLKRHGKTEDKHAEAMYEDSFLRFLRRSTSQEDEFVYFTGAVWAQLKKTVAYTVDILLSADDSTICKCQCECTAGEGDYAHCKHVIILLLSIRDYCSSGTYKAEKTCTDRLQTFHKPAGGKHKGSPLKASSLKRKNATEFRDPRPESYRKMESYPDYARNILINFKGEHDFPLMQTIEPANMYAIVNDHDYMCYDYEDNFLQILGVYNMTPQQIYDLEIATRGQAKNSLWHDERKNRITSTSFKKVCIHSTGVQLRTIAEEILQYKEDFTSSACAHGILNEEKAVIEFTKKTGIQTHECGLFVSKQFNYLAASPDRVIDKTSILEAKCSYAARNKPINPQTIPYLTLDDDGELSLKKNHEYYFQIMGQLLVTEASFCFLVLYTYVDFKIIEIKRDNEFIDNMAIKLNAFYDGVFRSAILKKRLYKS